MEGMVKTMRMDIFNKLNEEAKVNAMEQFVSVYGMDEFMEGTKWKSAEGIMTDFECGIDEHGNLFPPDDVWTLEELADEIVMGYAEVDRLYSVGIEHRRKAFNNAMDSAMVEYAKEHRFDQMTKLSALSAWCEFNDIYFLDDDGTMVFVG